MKVENKINKILMTLASVLIFGTTMVNARTVQTDLGLDLYSNATSSVPLNDTFERSQMGTKQMLVRAAQHLYEVRGLGL